MKNSQNFWHKIWQNFEIFQFWFNKLIKPAIFHDTISSEISWICQFLQKNDHFLENNEKSKFLNEFLRYQWDFAQSHLVWMAESASTWKRIMNARVQTSLKEKTAKILRINANFQITNVQVNILDVTIISKIRFVWHFESVHDFSKPRRLSTALNHAVNH